MGKIVALSTITEANTRFRIALDYSGAKALEQNRGIRDNRRIDYGKLRVDLKRDKKFVARNPVTHGLMMSVDNRAVHASNVNKVVSLAFEDGYTTKLGPLGRYQRLVSPGDK